MTDPKENVMIIAMADVSGFAKSAADKSDSEVFAVLDEFYCTVASIIEEAGGTVVKFMGDGALIAFPNDLGKEAVNALEEVKTRSQSLWSQFGEGCEVRSKAHIGPVAHGPMGPEQRFDVAGTTVCDLFRMPFAGTGISDELKSVIL